MSAFKPFYPMAGGTTGTTSLDATSQDIAVPSVADQVLISNLGDEPAFFRLKLAGDTTAATAADTPVLPNSQIIVSKLPGVPGEGQTLVAVVCPGGSGNTVYATGGFGF